MSKDEHKPVVIKKYANRRLYNTETSVYITLDDLRTLVSEGTDFVVYDAKSGDDITRSVLAQIIFEQETKGDSILPLNFLRQVISFYNSNMHDVLPRYLESSMEIFTQNQDKMHHYIESQFQNISSPFERLEEFNKQNMAIFEQTMRMFNPFDYQEEDTEKNNGKK